MLYRDKREPWAPWMYLGPDKDAGVPVVTPTLDAARLIATVTTVTIFKAMASSKLAPR